MKPLSDKIRQYCFNGVSYNGVMSVLNETPFKDCSLINIDKEIENGTRVIIGDGGPLSHYIYLEVPYEDDSFSVRITREDVSHYMLSVTSCSSLQELVEAISMQLMDMEHAVGPDPVERWLISSFIWQMLKLSWIEATTETKGAVSCRP